MTPGPSRDAGWIILIGRPQPICIRSPRWVTWYLYTCPKWASNIVQVIGVDLSPIQPSLYVHDLLTPLYYIRIALTRF